MSLPTSAFLAPRWEQFRTDAGLNRPAMGTLITDQLTHCLTSKKIVGCANRCNYRAPA